MFQIKEGQLNATPAFSPDPYWRAMCSLKNIRKLTDKIGIQIVDWKTRSMCVFMLCLLINCTMTMPENLRIPEDRQICLSIHIWECLGVTDPPMVSTECVLDTRSCMIGRKHP